uniref:DALR anticodon binding domain-containing protein n=1 Tax=Stomoxys calcitrans TaxID=35570 RepID=A0A1I8NLS6_STOCA
MSENPYQSLLLNIADHFVENIPTHDTSEQYRNITTLIRIHNDKLAKLGECSFSCKPEIWSKYFPASEGYQIVEHAFELLNETSEENRQDLLNEAKAWNFPVAKLEIEQERCHLHLQRSCIMKSLIQQVLCSTNMFGNMRKTQKRFVRLKPLQEYGLSYQDISFYRAQLVHQTLKRLLVLSQWPIVDDLADCHPVMDINVLSVASKVSQEFAPDVSVTIKCGLVTDPLRKGRVCQLPTEEYLSLRSNDMCLMALHKYGVRVKQDARFCALMKRLGSAAVTVDLLEVRNSSPVQIIRNGQGSTKGASFILYNSARLESLLRTFEERIDRRIYDPVPEINDIDYSLLKEEEEWQMAFAYLAGFPDLIDRCLEQLDRGLCATHLIIRFLNGLVAVFSIYYRRVRILTEKREQLMPYVYSRILLIRAVREILNKTLSLLDIEPVEFM